MDTLAPSASTTSTSSPRLPGWALPRGRDTSETDAAFAAGIALKSLDDLIRADPQWISCWRDRLAFKSAAVAARMFGRSEEETAIRDVVLLTAAGDGPGPAGKLFLATRMLTRRSGTVAAPFVKDPADLVGIDAQRSALALQHLAHQTLCRLGVAAALHRSLQDETVLIDDAPEPVLPSADRNDDCVEVTLVSQPTG